jgi:broad-specificity NMP kinase
MKKSILVTGVSGAGKTSLSKKLRDRGYVAHDLDDINGLFCMIDKNTKQPFINYDNDNLQKVKEMDWVCGVDKLKSIIANEIDKVVFYCGNASNLDEIIPLFDAVVLLKANSEVTRQRLSSRVSNDFGRTKEVQDWLINGKELWENEVEKVGAIVIDANQSLDAVTSNVIKSVLSKIS